jgi:glycosyltransferase involved in cell wall biosynthesis
VVISGQGRTKVSVIIPTFERREAVRRAVESVLAQSYSEFELIVVDDGSTDGTEEALAGLDPRLRYQRQTNGGAASARNAGLRVSEGDVVAFLDSDNRWLPDHLAVITEMLARHPEAVAASTCPDFRVKGRAGIDDARVVDLLPTLAMGTSVGYISCVAVRRGVLVAVGAFDEELPVWEDCDLFLRLAMRGPFTILGRRTIVHAKTRGGLHERGIRDGEYLRAMELSAAKAERELRGLDRSDLPVLLDSVRAKIMLVRGVGAAIDGRIEEARLALDEACRLRPDLSQRPGFVLANIRHGISRGRSPVDATATTALAWPDPGSDTARFLSMCTALLTFRTGRRRDAASWLARARPLTRPALLVRARRRTARLLTEPR